MDILQRLKHLRKNILKMSQEEFGKKIGLSKSNISNIEVGRIALTERNLLDICEKYRINEEWLKTGEGGDDNIFVKTTPYEKAYNRFGYLIENGSPTKKASLAAILELMYLVPDDTWELVVKQFNECLGDAEEEES